MAKVDASGVLSFLSLGLLGLTLAAPAMAGEKLASALFEGKPSLGKVSSHLLRARSAARGRTTMAEAARRDRFLQLRDGLPEVDVRLRSLSPQTLAELEARGLNVIEAYPEYARVFGTADPDALERIAELPDVTTIHPNYGLVRNVGATTSQADTVIRAASARQKFGVDGSGVRVGILSDSFARLIGGTVTGDGCAATLTGSGPQNSGDLPPQVTVIRDGPASPSCAEGGVCDEGAGLGELIHDLAPGAALLFRTAFPTEVGFARGIDQLINCGANVLVDDIIYFAEPMFQDGPVAQAAQRATDLGIPYFAASGNGGKAGILTSYVDVSPADDTAFPPSGADFQLFSNGFAFLPITVPPGGSFIVVLQWNQPFSGTLGPGASSDFDLYACAEPDPATCIAELSSIDSQGCAFGDGVRQGDPLEGIALVNTSTDQSGTIYLAVDQFCGPENVFLRLVTFDRTGGIVFDPSAFQGPQVYGHAAAAGAAAVGAVFYGEVSNPGIFQPPDQIDAERYSSFGGPLPFFFDGFGNPLPGAPVFRFKPEFAAPDGTNTSFFPPPELFGSTDVEGDGFQNFFGTSASAGHAAGVAALVRQASGLPGRKLIEVMAATALDIERPGIDERSGSGLIDAERAVGGTLCGGAGVTIVGTAGNDRLTGTAGTDVVNGLGGNDTITGGRGADFLCGNAGNDLLIGGDGDDVVFGDAGRDTVTGRAGNDVLLGNGGNDVLSDTNGANRLDGGSGTDDCTAGSQDAVQRCE